MSLYLIILISSIAIPFTLSFDKKLRFYRQWKYLLPAITIVALVYILFDIYFTHLGIWGFNARYHSNLTILGLPLEEWLFFLVIPYASIFLHDAFALYFPKIMLRDRTTKLITVALAVILGILVLFNTHKIYTLYISCTVIAALLFSLLDKTGAVNRFYITFLLILIPFLIVNSILTGSFIDKEVIWYNNSENLGIRFFTIPMEDFGYAFSLILFGILLRERLKLIFTNKTESK